MNVHAVQLDIVWEDKEANFRQVRKLLEAAPPSAGDLVVLPEFFATGFSMNVAGIAEDVCGKVETFLAELAAETGAFVLGGVAVRNGDGRGRNEAVAFDGGGALAARYCKLHPFSFGGEDAHYEAGGDLVTFEWGGHTVAPMICYDLRFPEAFRAAMDRGATVFPVIANWPLPRTAHWTALLRARAIENQAYVVGVNRCGIDPYLAYGGNSLIVDPMGNALAESGGEECVLRGAMDAAALGEYREKFPALRDRRRWTLGAE